MVWIIKVRCGKYEAEFEAKSLEEVEKIKKAHPDCKIYIKYIKKDPNKKIEEIFGELGIDVIKE